MVGLEFFEFLIFYFLALFGVSSGPVVPTSDCQERISLLNWAHLIMSTVFRLIVACVFFLTFNRTSLNNFWCLFDLLRLFHVEILYMESSLWFRLVSKSICENASPWSETPPIVWAGRLLVAFLRSDGLSTRKHYITCSL